jgi:formamidopyrimidine-DNA glycosylase
LQYTTNHRVAGLEKDWHILLSWGMPELAEVEYYRKQWDMGLGQRVAGLELHSRTRVFRGVDAADITAALRRQRFSGSWSRGKQMLFQFGRKAWVGIHLGMTGKLSSEPLPFQPDIHDHLVICLRTVALVFRDPRQFGRVRVEIGSEPPEWWRKIPASPHEQAFTKKVMAAFLARHQRLPIKATLLLQTGFAGVGNWMADEILWQARIAPARKTGDLSPEELNRLWRSTRSVCRKAMKTIGNDFGDPPRGWLFHERWSREGACPKHRTVLKCATIGGRTTAWCPQCQK